jgi:hypothetical protein
LFQIKKGLPIILYQIYSLRPQHNVEDWLNKYSQTSNPIKV